MKRLCILLVAFTLAGCGSMAYKDMTAEQIKATAGTTSCTQYEGLYGNAATIALNADDTRKGASSRGKMQITCGKASMTIENETSTPVPAVPVKP
jgi:uncharacterized protein YceK